MGTLPTKYFYYDSEVNTTLIKKNIVNYIHIMYLLITVI